MIRARAEAAVLVLGSAMLLAGCGGSDGSSTASRSEPGSPAVSSESAPTSAPLESPTPEVTETGPAPATGPEMAGDHIALRAPEGWRVKASRVNPFAWSAQPRGMGGSIALYDFPEDQPVALDREAEEAVRDSVDPGVKRVEDTTLAGVPAYQLAQTAKDGVPFVEVGIVHNGGDISLVFKLSTLLEPAEQQALIDSVLASVTWR